MVERKVRVVVVAAAAANDGEPEEPRVVVVVAATEGEPEGVVEATVLVQVVVVVVAATEGEGVEETSLLSAQWGLQKLRNRASLVKIIVTVMFVQMLAHFTI